MIVGSSSSGRVVSLHSMQQVVEPIRVVVADDSTVMRRIIGDALRATGRISIVAEASDGAEAISRCSELNPDVLTLDLSMPNVTGIDVLAALQASRSTVCVVVVSSFSPALVEQALDVLDAGAADLVPKPGIGAGFEHFTEQLRVTVLAIAAARRRPAATGEPARSRVQRDRSDTGRVLAFASSTGGPRALGRIVPLLGCDIGAGGVIVQHMPEGFTAALANRLDAASELDIREAANGDSIRPSTLLVAPAGRHLRFRDGRARLDDAAPVGGLRPRADLTVCDLAEDLGPRLVLVVLTGMGNDGLDGARATRDAGGIVLAQAESDCVVYGMPRHVIEHDLADAVATSSELAALIGKALAEPC
jgi:two-component system chemotaxis response regulator CheB